MTDLTSFPISVRPVPTAPHDLGVFATRAMDVGEVVWCEQTTATLDDADLASIITQWPDFDPSMKDAVTVMCLMQKARASDQLRAWIPLLTPRFLELNEANDSGMNEAHVATSFEMATVFHQITHQEAPSVQDAPLHDIFRMMHNRIESKDETDMITHTLFGLGSMFNHACAPNATVLRFRRADNVVCMRVVALERIPVGGEITLTYMLPYCNNEQVRAACLESKCITCRCYLCIEARDADEATPVRALTSMISPVALTLSPMACLWCAKESHKNLAMQRLACNELTDRQKKAMQNLVSGNSPEWLCSNACRLLCNKHLRDFVVPVSPFSSAGSALMATPQFQAIHASSKLVWTNTDEARWTAYKRDDHARLLDGITALLPSLRTAAERAQEHRQNVILELIRADDAEAHAMIAEYDQASASAAAAAAAEPLTTPLGALSIETYEEAEATGNASANRTMLERKECHDLEHSVVPNAADRTNE